MKTNSLQAFLIANATVHVAIIVAAIWNLQFVVMGVIGDVPRIILTSRGSTMFWESRGLFCSLYETQLTLRFQGSDSERFAEMERHAGSTSESANHFGFGLDRSDRRMPYWLRDSVWTSTADLDNAGVRRDIALGFPFNFCWVTVHSTLTPVVANQSYQSVKTRRYEGATWVELGLSPFSQRKFNMLLPFRVRFEAVFGNIVLIGLAIGLCQAGFRCVRKAWLKSNLRCATCGYPATQRGSSCCPECGGTK